MGSVTIEVDQISEDKREIVQEEKEKILNKENKSQDNVASDSGNEGTKIKTDFKEGREVKPRKIPIGGIQMPGFFTRSRSKEKCKEGDSEAHETDVEGTELLNKNDKDTPEDSLMNQQKVMLPFRSSKNGDAEKGPESEDKQRLFDRICKPLVSIFPKKKNDADKNLENQTAGLASIETLDDNDKSADRKEEGTIDTSGDEKTNEFRIGACIHKLKPYHFIICAILGFFIIVMGIMFITFKDSDGGTPSALIDGNKVQGVTSCGKVEGILNDDAIAFRGIPYARPPLGDLRFKPAQPLNSIDYCWNGTLLAHNPTDACLQILGNGTVTGVEDCLTLDVITPYVRYTSPLPVVVLIGAETFVGGSPAKMRPSTRYARSRDVVFVRPNFRLGTLGFLAAHSAREYPGMSGNYALTDIAQALKWIQLNIVHFGGNPEQVTLFGHRAGATLVTALSTMRNANKLFARAWATSGGTVFPNTTLEESERKHETFLKAIECKPDDVECLRRMSAITLTTSIDDTWRQTQPDLPEKFEKPLERHQWMVLDGKILRKHPVDVASQGKGLPVHLVLGISAHSLATEKLLNKYTEWTEDLVTKHVKDSILSDYRLVDEVLQLYPKTYKGLSTMISDLRGICPLYEMYKSMRNTSLYVVTQPRGPQNIADVDSDVDAILGRYEPKTPEQRRYTSAIQQLFYHFVWHGKMDDRARYHMLIVEQGAWQEDTYPNCDFWIRNNMTVFAQLD